MKFHTRKWVKPEDLNPNATLFGGRLLAWIDEEAALYTVVQLNNSQIVTKLITEIDFKSSAKEGDIIEIGIEVIKFGIASITLHVEVRNMMTKNTILTIEKIVMVNLDADGKPAPHGKTQTAFTGERLK
jgi:acyl-CoA hydrolase